MANRRMFSLDVIDTDRFLDLPPTTQNLYFHLGMRADDDGFVRSPRMVATLSRSTAEDLKILIEKGFVIPFPSQVLVITDWRQNNYIRTDRYKPTRFQKEKELLMLEGDSYRLSTNGIPGDNQCETQVRLGKYKYISFKPSGLNGSDSEEKNADEPVIEPQEKRFDEQTEEDFEKIYAVYPRKQGKAKALRYYRQWVKGRKINGKSIRLDRKQVYLAVARYAEEQAGKEQQFVKMASTFFNTDILDYIPTEEDED